MSELSCAKLPLMFRGLDFKTDIKVLFNLSWSICWEEKKKGWFVRYNHAAVLLRGTRGPTTQSSKGLKTAHINQAVKLKMTNNKTLPWFCIFPAYLPSACITLCIFPKAAVHHIGYLAIFFLFCSSLFFCLDSIATKHMMIKTALYCMLLTIA